MRSIEVIETLSFQLRRSKTVFEKIVLLDAQESVVAFLRTEHPLRLLLKEVSPEAEVLLKQLIAIDQPSHPSSISQLNRVNPFYIFRQDRRERL